VGLATQSAGLRTTVRIRVRKWGELTVAYCEQATEFYVRKARQAIRRFIKNPSPTKAGTAADHIIRARIARCQYLTILGERATNEDEMTFAHNMY
jgi:hypothetical protein